MTQILVIDDEETIITYLTLLLQDSGYETLSALDADEGLAIARTHKPHLITLDIMMPKRSGLSAYAEIKSDPELRDIPVIIVSGFTTLCDLRDPKAFRKIVRDEAIPEPEVCLEKPVDVPLFLESVARLTNSDRSESAETPS